MELESQQVTPRNSHPYPDPGRSPLSLTPNPNSQLDRGEEGVAELKRRASSTDTLSPPPTALSPGLSDQGPESKSRQINAAREWLANTEGMVTATSPLLKTTPADEPPAINLGVDDAAGGDKAAAPRSPVDLGKATGDLMKGIGGSLRNMGSALFGANKSTPPSSPGEPEKPKMPESSSV